MKLRLKLPLLVVSFVTLSLSVVTAFLSAYHYRTVRQANESAVRFINSALQVTVEKYLLAGPRNLMEYEKMNLTLNKSLSQASGLDGVVYIAVLDTDSRLLKINFLKDPSVVFGSSRRGEQFDIPALRRSASAIVEWPVNAVWMEFQPGSVSFKTKRSGFLDDLASVFGKKPKQRVHLFRYRTPVEYRYFVGDQEPVIKRLGFIETGVSRDYIVRSIGSGLNALIVPILLILAGLISLVLFLTRSILRSIDVLSAGTIRLADGRWDTRIDLNTRDEFGEWARIFNDMADKQEKTLYVLQEKYSEIRRLFKLSSEDGLTKVFTRRHLLALTESVLKYEGQNRNLVSLLMTDIDHFKRFNDTWGHQAGDLVLQETARILYENTRKERDIVGRYGGEEFMIVLPGVGQYEAMAVADKLRLITASSRFRYQDQELSVTISIGVTTAKAEEVDASTLIRRADRGLYISKESGRNRVTYCEEAGSVDPEPKKEPG
jgi:diguanylate cyclase (GGDEF)-like protein